MKNVYYVNETKMKNVYKYMYISMCVCVCVCVYTFLQLSTHMMCA